MLPGLSIEHLIILGVIALVVVGPKDLPLLLRKMGQWTARLRGMAQEFRSGFDELARQAELDELRKEVDALRHTTNLNSISKEFSKPLGTMESYAGLSPPPPPASASPSMGEAPQSDGGGAPPVANNEPSEAHMSAPLASPPQSSLSNDSSSIEEEQEAPVQRTAP